MYFKSQFQIMICYFVAFRMPCIYRRQLSNLDRCLFRDVLHATPLAAFTEICMQRTHVAAFTLFFPKKKKRKLIFHFLPLLFSRGDRRLDYRCCLSVTRCQAPAWLGRILFRLSLSFLGLVSVCNHANAYALVQRRRGEVLLCGWAMWRR